VAFYRLHGSNELSKHRRRMVGEMENWIADMERVPAIRTNPGFGHFRDYVTYNKAIDYLLACDRAGAWRSLRELALRGWRLRLLLLIMLPGFVVRRIKN
jgi:hypothetical protein